MRPRRFLVTDGTAPPGFSSPTTADDRGTDRRAAAMMTGVTNRLWTYQDLFQETSNEIGIDDLQRCPPDSGNSWFVHHGKPGE